VLDFLASTPTPDDILAFRPSPDLQGRASALLEKQRNTGLTDAERAALFGNAQQVAMNTVC